MVGHGRRFQPPSVSRVLFCRQPKPVRRHCAKFRLRGQTRAAPTPPHDGGSPRRVIRRQCHPRTESNVTSRHGALRGSRLLSRGPNVCPAINASRRLYPLPPNQLVIRPGGNVLGGLRRIERTVMVCLPNQFSKCLTLLNWCVLLPV